MLLWRFFTEFLTKDLGISASFFACESSFFKIELCARLACRGSRRASEYRRSAFIKKWRRNKFRNHANTAEESTLRDIFAVRNQSSVSESMTQWGLEAVQNGKQRGSKSRCETIIYVRYALESSMVRGANTTAKTCKFTTLYQLAQTKNFGWIIAIWLLYVRCTMRCVIEEIFHMMRSKR